MYTTMTVKRDERYVLNVIYYWTTQYYMSVTA